MQCQPPWLLSRPGFISAYLVVYKSLRWFTSSSSQKANILWPFSDKGLSTRRLICLNSVVLPKVWCHSQKALNKVTGASLTKAAWSPRVFFTLFSGWIPIWGVEARHVYLLALASKTHARGSPRRGTLYYSNGRRWPNVDGANLSSPGFISSPHKPSYSGSFLHQFSYYTISSWPLFIFLNK